MAGYSGTPLARKLGFRPDVPAVVIGCPKPYADLLGEPASPEVLQPGAPLPPGLAFLHLFTASRGVLESVLAAARPALAPDGMIWVSWPKKASRQPCDFTEDGIRAAALPLGLVDIKVCAVDEVWSGLKLVIRRDQR